MKPVIRLATAFSILATGYASGAEQHVVCPTRLEPDAVQPNRPPSGWQLHMLRPVYLTEGGMLHGPPAESAFLVPDGGATLKLFRQVAESATECTLSSQSADGVIKEVVEFVCK
ncbi:hypothetical protein GTP91_02250 [Rugamonas sp. FT82W]|uniref:Uncharacterized protein n=1 Tax=Duganella vulcania TaxID=2692166 RepID=A0A845FYX6_9BURK|nr:STY0301 family protein [Duganella vulcania]MYM85997.1 hypothetical protein [Duganella vulcania]